MRYIFILLLIACSPHDFNSSTGKSTNLYKDHEIWSPKIVISRGEQVVITSSSEKLTKNNNEDAILSGSVITDFFNESGEHVSVLYSDTTAIDEYNNNFESYGHVTVKSDSGLTLKTNRIIYDNRYRVVTSKDSVMFTTSQLDTIYGVGFESDMDLTNWRIDKPSGVTNHWLK